MLNREIERRAISFQIIDLKRNLPIIMITTIQHRFLQTIYSLEAQPIGLLQTPIVE